MRIFDLRVIAGFVMPLIVVSGCDAGLLGRNDPPRVLECPDWGAGEVSAVIGPDGGSVGTASYRLTLQGGAVAEPTTFWMRPAPGEEVRIEVTAEGHEDFQFSAPAFLTLGYERCRNASPTRLEIFEVDEQGEVVDQLGGEHDRTQRRVRAQVDHLSIFVLAEP